MKNHPKTCLVRKKINFLSSLFSRDSLCRKPKRQVFSRRGLCCLLNSSRTNTSSATDNNIKNIYNEKDILTGITVFDCTLHRLRNYGPQSRGTAGVFDFRATGLWYDHKCGSRGEQGVRTPPLENHKLYEFLKGISNWTPPPPPRKKLDPTGKCWTHSGTLKMIGFFEIDHLTSVK